MVGFYRRILRIFSRETPPNTKEPSDGNGKASGQIKAIDPEQTYLSAADKTASASSLPTTSLMQRKVTHLLQQKPSRELYIRSGVNPQSELTQLTAGELPVDSSLILAYKSKGLATNFNGKVTSKKDQKLITCSHLAYAFATGVFGGKIQEGTSVAKGEKFAGVDSLDKIASHPSIPTNEQLYNTPIWSGIAKEAYYFAGQAIGLSIHRVAQQLSYEGDSKHYLVHSENHTMALAIERLADSSFKLAFYDPNETIRVQQIVVSNLEALKKITIKDLIPDSNDAAQYLLDAAHGGLLYSTDTVKKASDAQIKINGSINASIMHLLIRHGHLGNQDTKDCMYKQLQLQLNSNDQGHLERIFWGKTTDSSPPALFWALQNGHPETITAFFEGIKSLGLDDDKAFLKGLVIAERKDETPGLFMAMHFGHPETITAFFEGIKSLGLDDDKAFLKDLVTAERKDETPGLFVAMQNGHPETITAFFEGIKSLGLDDDEAFLKGLVTAERKDGTPGLFVAMRNENPKVIEAFFKGIESLGLTGDTKFLKGLVTAERKDGTPGLFVAMRNENPKVIEAFFKGIESLGLTGDTKFLKDLVTAEIKNGASGLLIALLCGCLKPIKALFTGVENLDMSDQEKNDLLKNPLWMSYSGIQGALQKEKETTVATYLNLMMEKKFITSETLNNALSEVVSSNQLTLRQLASYFTNMIKHNRATVGELEKLYEQSLKNSKRYNTDELSLFWDYLKNIRT
ncbi:MAG: ShET2/EspL2 family type III secretion system effector toxin [Endozoicomonas sp. (ex Botrylloides leachii)]|nr:ShET2/EspL2 family type III secretion system effector toxin [Endozoicomonas sp. (ex Botrylloides leachii)]